MADVKLRRRTISEYECVLSRGEIIQLLNKHRTLSYVLPDDTEVTVTAPRGGDYSGVQFDIDEAGGMRLAWTVTAGDK